MKNHNVTFKEIEKKITEVDRSDTGSIWKTKNLPEYSTEYDYYILVALDNENGALVNLKTGNRWNDLRPFNEIDISQFELVHSGLLTIEI